MSVELERRIAKLEEEMADLRQELSLLKGSQSAEKINTLDARQSMIKQSEPIKPKPVLESRPIPTKVTERSATTAIDGGTCYVGTSKSIHGYFSNGRTLGSKTCK